MSWTMLLLILGYLFFLERAFHHRSKARKYRYQRDWLYRAFYADPHGLMSKEMEQVLDELDAEKVPIGQECPRIALVDITEETK